MRDFKDLIAWQRGMDLVQSVYAATRLLPDDERFGLVTQMRRAAVSIPSNIAEGHGRNSRGEYIQFIGIARGSLGELETQSLLCQRISLIPEAEITDILAHCTELKRILDGLRNSLLPPNDRRRASALTPNP
ncbi:MAG TPA: four helix bundle protein [Planctomycetes bacterium]|nr:four helix bundle protein [Planctomycetota bacterium]